MSSPLIAITCSWRDTGDGPWSAQQQVAQPYLTALQMAGAIPLLIPHLDDPAAMQRQLDLCDGLLVTGGPDFDPRESGQQPRAKFGGISPERDRVDRVCLHFAMDRPQMPLLGICRGVQSINVIAGGTLIQDIPSEVDQPLKHAQSGAMYYGTHDVDVVEGSRLRSIFGAARWSVNTSHHQAVLEPAPGWEVVARAEDGVIEAIERNEGGFGLGCQFHPEVMVRHDERMAAIFQAFADACRG